ncbi:MAG: hypothetical protein MUE31_06535, partial [Candidatus Nanopelagicales bacterium]|nr:hypothetical protein [Candidatus Nanopelagicales bacterium]
MRTAAQICTPGDPAAFHPAVAVDCDATRQASQQMFAQGGGLQHGPAGEVDRRVTGHPEVTTGQHAPGQRLIEASRRTPDGITFGHPPIVG